MAYIIKYIGANQGGLYLVENNDSQVNIRLTACYAYERKKFIEQTILPGQGLLGQTFLEKEYIYLTQIPQNYISITSGLGEARPSCLLIMPLMINNTVEGLFEIASFKELAQHQISFIQKLSETIASFIQNNRINEQTKKLLAISQQQAEEMRAQEEEMRQNMEELEATQEEARRVSSEIQAQTSIINNIALVTKTDLQGNITYVNDEFLKWSKYTENEVKGRNHRFLKSGEHSDELFKDIWETISSGKIFRGEIRNKAKDGSFYWVDAIIAPVLGEDGKPKEYIAQCFVINEAKKKEARLAQALQQAQQLEKQIRQHIEQNQDAELKK
jgi:PAS domain S-box-containing protein